MVVSSFADLALTASAVASTLGGAVAAYVAFRLFRDERREPTQAIAIRPGSVDAVAYRDALVGTMLIRVRAQAGSADGLAPEVVESILRSAAAEVKPPLRRGR